MTAKITFIGNFAFFEGQKYWHKDIRLLADMRRKGILGGTLEGDELEAFVVKCLRTADYQVLGLPMTAEDYALVQRQQPAAA